jgi:DNA helicase IV
MLTLPDLSSLTSEHDTVLGKPLGSSFIVIGPPGTGKTIMAIYRASMLAGAGRKTLLLMFGRVLSEYTKAAIAAEDLSGIVSTYHSWFPQFWKRCYGGRPPKVSQWIFDWRACLQKIITSPPPASERCHIVVDEGQDMPKDFYILLKFIGESLTIFADENQRITAEQSTIAEIKTATGIKDVVSLSANYRNTREIAEFAASFYTGLQSGIPALPSKHGERPFLLTYLKLHQTVSYISEYENANPGLTIGVLLQRADEAISFYNRLEKRVVNPAEIYLSSKQGNNPKVRQQLEFEKPGIKILTYASAKGLEFDTVFLPELQSVTGDSQGDDLRMRFYVMASRAKRTLGLLYTGDSEPKFVAALPMNLIDDKRLAPGSQVSVPSR